MRQRQQARPLLGEHGADAAVGIGRAAPLGGQAVAPVLRLGIEVVEVGEAAGGEEGQADIADGALDTAFGAAGASNNGFNSTAFGLATDNTILLVGGQFNVYRNAARTTHIASLDPATGAVLSHERFTDKTTGEHIYASVFPLHSGSYFGFIGVLLWGLASLMMPVFFVTGWLLYLGRRKAKAKRLARLRAQPAE